MAILALEVGTLRFDSVDTQHAAVREGQLERILSWLDGHEYQLGEESPVGLILCAESSREPVALLQTQQQHGNVLERTVFQSGARKKLHAALFEGRGAWTMCDDHYC